MPSRARTGQMSSRRGPSVASGRAGCRGVPFVLTSRVMTEAFYALALRGCTVEHIHKLYKELSPEGTADAARVEAQLAKNLARAA